MKKAIDTILSLILIVVIAITPLGASAATITQDNNTGETIISHEVSETYTVTIPEYIEATQQGEETNDYTVVAENIIIPSEYELHVNTLYSNKLHLKENNDVYLNYDIYKKTEKESVEEIISGDNVLIVPAGQTAGASAKIYAVLRSDIDYAGVYLDTVTFSIGVVQGTTHYTEEEIESNPYVYGIGATKREYVVATFNEDYSEVTITKNGEDSDGIMVDWITNTKPFELPMFTHKSTLEKATICEGVMNVGDFAFVNITGLKTVSLPSTIERIGERSFYKTSISNIDIPNGVKEIAAHAFRECTSLTGDLVIPDSVVNILDYAFSECYNIDGNLIIGDGVEFIAEFAFGTDNSSKPMSFKSVYFGKSIKVIGHAAFQLCNKISNSITLPEGLEVIGDFAFNHWDSAANNTLIIPKTVIQIGGTTNSMDITPENYKDINYIDIGTHTFYGFGTKKDFERFEVEESNVHYKDIDGVLFSKDGKRLLSYPASKRGTEYAIPEGVEKIDELAFGKNYLATATTKGKKLTTIILPDSYIIKSKAEQEGNIVNLMNSLTNSIYQYSGISEVRVKDSNPNYISYDGCIYTKDGKTCLYIPAFRNNVTILEGCENITEAYFAPSASLVSGYSGVYNFYIPESVVNMTICDDLNKFVKREHFTVTITINENNPIYTVNEYGEIVEK